MPLRVLKRLLVGTPIPTTLAKHERLGRATGLAVFASDALSSVAYATEEILLILVLAGTMALWASVPIGLGIAALNRLGAVFPGVQDPAQPFFVADRISPVGFDHQCVTMIA